jgi:hypothetical protein
MKAERVEELGRLREKLGSLLSCQLLDWGWKNQDAFVVKYLNAHTDDFVEMHQQIKHLKESILECWKIAKGDEK